MDTETKNVRVVLEKLSKKHNILLYVEHSNNNKIRTDSLALIVPPTTTDKRK